MKPPTLSPRIELRRVHHSQHMSRETSCFSADVWIDGAKAGTVENDGQGGADRHYPRELGEQLAAIASTLPGFDLHGDGKKLVPHNPETLIGLYLDRWQVERYLKRTLKTSLVFTSKGKPGLRSLRLPPVVLALTVKDPVVLDRMRTERGIDVVLNTMPLPQAVEFAVSGRLL